MNGSTMRSRKKSNDTLKQMKMKTQQPKMYRIQWKCSQKKIQSKKQKISNKQSNITLKGTRKRRTKPSEQKEGNNKDKNRNK